MIPRNNLSAFSLTPYGQSLAAEWRDWATDKAERFARKYHLDPDEVESEAQLVLVRLLALYNPNLGPLEPFLGTKMWLDLIDWMRPRSAAARFFQKCRSEMPIEAGDGGRSAEAAYRSAIAGLVIGFASGDERRVLTGYYREGKTNSLVAADLACSPQHVSHLRRRGIDRIRSHPRMAASS